MRLADIPVVHGIRHGDRKERTGWLLLVTAASAVLAVRLLAIFDVLPGRPFALIVVCCAGVLILASIGTFLSRGRRRPENPRPADASAHSGKDDAQSGHR